MDKPTQVARPYILASWDCTNIGCRKDRVPGLPDKDTCQKCLHKPSLPPKDTP